MNLPPWLAKRLALAKKAGFELDVSHCGCALPAGAWGAHGWHWTRADQPLLYRREKVRFAQERPDMSRAALADAWQDWLETETAAGRMDRGGMHERWRIYLGLPVAYERCPAYMAAYARSLGQEKAERQARGRQKILGGED